MYSLFFAFTLKYSARPRNEKDKKQLILMQISRISRSK